MACAPQWVTSRRSFLRGILMLGLSACVFASVDMKTGSEFTADRARSAEGPDSRLSATQEIVDEDSEALAEDAYGAEKRQSSPGAADEAVTNAYYMRIFEIVLAIVSAVSFIWIVRGYRRNRDIVEAAVAVLRPLLEPQFSRLGVIADGKAIHVDGPADFYYYATGRLYTTGMTVQFKMKKRMDLFATFLGLMETVIPDRCVFTLPLSDDFVMEPISLLLIKRKELRRLRESSGMSSAAVKSVENLAGVARENIQGLHDSWTLLADHADVLPKVLPAAAFEAVASVSDMLQSLHITDTGASWDAEAERVKRMVRLEFDLPVSSLVEDMAKVLNQMVAVAISLVDGAATVKLTAAARSKALELRRRLRVDEQKARMRRRQEVLEEERESKKREEEERLMKMPATQQAKIEEKRRKKEFQKRVKKLAK